MKKFITTEILPDLLSDLAGKFLENNDKISIDISLMQYTNCSHPTLEIKVLRSGTWETMSENKYDVINKTYDGYDVLKESVQDALNQF